MVDRRAAMVPLRGWGRTSASRAHFVRSAPADVAGLVRSSCSEGILARGLGRSYGDAASNAGGTVLAPIDPQGEVVVDLQGPSVTAPAGVSIGRLLQELVPRGLMLPVVPGTQHVTLGGAIAADVHGKSHHADSSFGAWVEQLLLVDGTGETRWLRPERDPEEFWATVGGMGLTGVVLAATVRLHRVETSRIRARTTAVRDLDALLDVMSSRQPAPYEVAWVDCLAPGRHRYRAILDQGWPAAAADLPSGGDPLALRPAVALAAPPLPVSPLRPGMVRAFNAARWRRAPAAGETVRSLDAFFFPLDRVGGWNRLYGPRGLVQYQFVVPLPAADVVSTALGRFASAGVPPYLTVLKRMGTGTPGPLSFPMPGWTLAVDVPAAADGLDRLLRDLDHEVAAAGGRVYLAKDSRAGADAVAAMYPRLPEWQETRDRLDPAGRLRSDLGRRTGLTR